MSAMPGRRVLIYGAGNIGCYLGGRLDGQTWSNQLIRSYPRPPQAQTTPVRYLARPAMLQSLRTHGLTLSDLHGYQRHLPGDALDLHTDPAEALSDVALVLVTVKSSATPQVAEELAAHLPPQAVVVSFQNGLRNAALLRERLPGHTVLAGMVPFNVVRRGPGEFHQGSSGQLAMESYDRLAFDGWLSLFQATGLPVHCHADLAPVQQAKLLLNLNNAINALSDLPLREELSQRDWRRCLALAQREALHVYAAAGLQPARLTPLPTHWLPAVLELPDRWFGLLASRMLAIDPLARSSTWEDLQAGRPSEVDAIQGEVVELAAAHGLRAPVNARLLALVREVERQPRRYGAGELLEELRRAAS